MDGFFVGLLIVAVLSTNTFVSCSYGKSSIESEISKDCENFSSMSIDDNVYQCTLIKNNQDNIK